MNRRTFNRSALGALAALLAGPALLRAQEEEIYGRQLMTQEEIREHRRSMQELRGEEREAYRQQHHERMTERARERGVELPDTPRGPGAGRGDGARQGGGSGPGDGSGRRNGPGAGGGRGR